MLKPFPSCARLFLWASRALYFGSTQHLAMHSHAGVALHVGVYRPFRLKLVGGEWQTCRCAVIPAGLAHELDFAGGIHGKFFVERDSVDFLYFTARFPYDSEKAMVFYDEDLVQCLRGLYEDNPCKEQVDQQLTRLLGADGQLSFSLEPRIQKAIELICSEPDYNFSKEQLAAMACLSPSRFLHLFKAQAGVPYRQFRTWKRLFLAMECLHRNDNMTEAALLAGFSDATHFSHSFRETFGVKPSFVFKHIERFESGRPGF